MSTYLLIITVLVIGANNDPSSSTVIKEVDSLVQCNAVGRMHKAAVENEPAAHKRYKVVYSCTKLDSDNE